MCSSDLGQGRWRLLTEEERQRLWSKERWQTSLSQIGASLGRLLQLASGVVGGLGSWLVERRAARPASTKKWVRPEAEATTAEAAEATAAVADVVVPEADPPVVSSFGEIDALLEQAVPEAAPEPAAPEPGEGLGEAG